MFSYNDYLRRSLENEIEKRNIEIAVQRSLENEIALNTYNAYNNFNTYNEINRTATLAVLGQPSHQVGIMKFNPFLDTSAEKVAKGFATQSIANSLGYNSNHVSYNTNTGRVGPGHIEQNFRNNARADLAVSAACGDYLGGAYRYANNVAIDNYTENVADAYVDTIFGDYGKRRRSKKSSRR